MTQAGLLKKLNNRFLFRLFLLRSLPAAFFSGIRIGQVSLSSSVILVRYSWFSQNPFQSIYFACLSMAAEMSSGILALVHTRDKSPKVSMLVLGVESSFHKKAVGTIRFECNDGEVIQQAISATISTGQGTSCDTLSKGFDQQGRCVAEFKIKWSFKQKEK
jgi:phage terminase large subunit-like protein